MPFPDLPGRVGEVRDRIRTAAGRGAGQPVTIVAVTKTHGPDAVMAAWNAGIADVGENRVQEALTKMPQVTVPARWHMIGHMQRNKVDSLDRFVMLQSLDSERLADAVHRVGAARGRPVDVLVEVNTSGEASKGGYALETLSGESDRLRALSGLQVRGVMTMAPLGADERVLRETFAGARRAREILEGGGHPATALSMGMSNDYEVAVEEGATIVRLGTVLFGARPT